MVCHWSNEKYEAYWVKSASFSRHVNRYCRTLWWYRCSTSSNFSKISMYWVKLAQEVFSTLVSAIPGLEATSWWVGVFGKMLQEVFFRFLCTDMLSFGYLIHYYSFRPTLKCSYTSSYTIRVPFAIITTQVVSMDDLYLRLSISLILCSFLTSWKCPRHKSRWRVVTWVPDGLLSLSFFVCVSETEIMLMLMLMLMLKTVLRKQK